MTSHSPLRRHVVRAATWSLLAAATAGATLAHAQDASIFPQKPLRLLVGFSPGGTTDIVARVLGQKLGDLLGQSVVVENRSGADGNIAARAVAQSPADGYTLLVAPNGLAINASLYSNPGYDAIHDFAPISLIGDAPNFVVVTNSLPVTNIEELLALAKVRNGELNYASSAPAGHLATAMFNSMAEIEMVRIPYKGAGEAIPAIISGEVDVFITGVVNMVGQVKADRVRAIAVTGTQRYAQTPDVPTVAESGLPGYSASTWYGLLAPAGTPSAIVDKLNAAVREAMNDPDVKERLDEQGLDATPGTPQEFADFIRVEIDKWSKVAHETGARVE
ncbi:MAG: tripartite tricarboxylate transporter substrate binding protein [Pigmentiphaga sp.]